MTLSALCGAQPTLSSLVKILAPTISDVRSPSAGGYGRETLTTTTIAAMGVRPSMLRSSSMVDLCNGNNTNTATHTNREYTEPVRDFTANRQEDNQPATAATAAAAVVLKHYSLSSSPKASVVTDKGIP